MSCRSALLDRLVQRPFRRPIVSRRSSDALFKDYTHNSRESGCRMSLLAGFRFSTCLWLPSFDRLKGC